VLARASKLYVIFYKKEGKLRRHGVNVLPLAHRSNITTP